VAAKVQTWPVVQSAFELHVVVGGAVEGAWQYPPHVAPMASPPPPASSIGQSAPQAHAGDPDELWRQTSPPPHGSSPAASVYGTQTSPFEQSESWKHTRGAPGPVPPHLNPALVSATAAIAKKPRYRGLVFHFKLGVVRMV
jgi:hypothetical protein